MTYLFFFAHPDDETVACASTIRQLADRGDEVIVISATDGSAGEVHERSQAKLKELGSVGALRRHEMRQVSQLLHVTKLHILDFVDGEITNAQVWGKLTSAFIDLIDQYKPQAIITFDHTGWYYHLDHVGVSIAATLAYHQSTHRPDALLLSYMQVKGSKWKYIFPREVPITHVVDATPYKEMKLQALDLHASQNVDVIKQKVQSEQQHVETFQLAFASEKGQELFAKHPVFKQCK